MIGDPEARRRAADAAAQQADAARRVREQARRARGVAAAMAADNVARRVRMGELLWRIYQQVLRRRAGA